jgi:Sec-independent protein translocase protein TatA
MKRSDEPSTSLQPWARLLIGAALMLALSLLAAASLPLSAPAMGRGPGPTRAGISEVEAETSDEEGEEEDESESEEESEEDEEEEFETAHAVPLPASCILRSAEPSVAVQLERGDVRLTVRYEAEEPLRADIDFWLKGSKGSLQLGSASPHLGEHGAIHLHSRPDEREMAKVRAARAFLVSIDLPQAPSYCARYLTLRLTSKHQLAKRETWLLPLERRRG